MLLKIITDEGLVVSCRLVEREAGEEEADYV